MIYLDLDGLKKFNGVNCPSYISIKNVIFDVSDSEFYKPNGNYYKFVGKDASVALAKMSISEDYMN